ncbi:MAG: FKBP-type peptidyl-prolyl cis-trans isomerase [Acidobacteriota bacterium]
MRLSRVLVLILVTALSGVAACSEPATEAPATNTPAASAPAPAPAAVPAPPDVAKPPADASTAKSGLAWKVLKAGTGTIHPTLKSTFVVHYTGWTTDGQMFDSSSLRGEPLEMPLARVIDGWKEGMQLMVIGEKRRFWIPEILAYQGQPGSPAGMLVFDIELLDIK